MVPRRTRNFSIFGLFLGIFFLVFGIFWEKIFYIFVEKSLTLGIDSPIYDIWHSPPMDMTVDIYLFNWTNPQDFRNPSIKPKFQELGPYRFSERQEKVDIVWHAENASVTYRKKSFYDFIPEGSRGNLDDVITTINSVAMTAATVSQHLSTTQRTLAEIGMMVYPRDLTVRRTADELLFTGYKDTLLRIINMLPMSNFDMPFDKYGYCYGRNDSAKFYGVYNVFTGADNIKELGQLHTWNHKDQSDYYGSKCNKIRGSPGEFMGPRMKAKDRISIFGRELCRDMPLEYDDVAYVDGIKGFRYVAGPQAIDNGTLYPENACLCNGECLPSGVMNISSCWFQSPLFASYPHFYQADPYYLSLLEGLEPHQHKHEFTYVIEPKTSIPLDVVARSQMNLYVQPISRSRMFHDVRKIMFPLTWVEVRTRLTPKLLAHLKTLSKVVFYGQIVAGAIAILSILTAICYPLLMKYKFLSQIKRRNEADGKSALKVANTSDVNQNLDLKLTKFNKEISRESQQPLL